MFAERHSIGAAGLGGLKFLGSAGAADSVSYPAGTSAGMLAIVSFIEVGAANTLSNDPTESTGWTGWGSQGSTVSGNDASFRNSYKILDATDISAGTFTPQWLGGGTTRKAVAVAVFSINGTSVSRTASGNDSSPPYTVTAGTSGAAAPFIVAAHASFDRSLLETTADLASDVSSFSLQTTTSTDAFVELGWEVYPTGTIADSIITCTDIGSSTGGRLGTAYFEIT